MEREAALSEDFVVRATTGSRAERRAAQDELFRTHRERVFGLCFHLTGNRHDAEDALQEVFLAVFRALPRFRGESKLSTWIYRIAVRTALRTKARGTRRTVPLETDVPARGDDPALRRERAAEISRALAELSAEHRVVVSLFAVEGLPHREIAAILGIPEGTVWSRLHLARKQLAKKLRPRCGQTLRSVLHLDDEGL